MEMATVLGGGQHKTAIIEIQVGYNHVIVKSESDDGENWTDITYTCQMNGMIGI